MIEILRHVLGFCGEHWHPNIWTAIASTPIIAPIVYYFKVTWRKWFTYSKNKFNNN